MNDSRPVKGNMPRRQACRAVLLIFAAFSCLIGGCGNPPVSMVLKYEVDRKRLGHQRVVDMEALIAAINRRIAGSGQARLGADNTILVDIYGAVGEVELEYMEKLIGAGGRLEFRALADSERDGRLVQQAQNVQGTELKDLDADARLSLEEHATWIAAAKKTNEQVVLSDDRERARWVTIEDADKIAAVEDDKDLVTRNNTHGTLQKLVMVGQVRAEWIENPVVQRDESGRPTDFRVHGPAMVTRDREDGGRDVLVVIDYFNVGGDLLSSVRGGYQDGRRCVDFNFNSKGAKRFGSLTSALMVDSGRKRKLGIILDKQLLTAPVLNSVIHESGQITGDFTDADIDWLVAVLNAGRLPCPIRKVGQIQVAD